MQVHLLIALHTSIVLLEAAASALDLHPAARLLLNMLDIGALSTYNIGAEVEAGYRFEVDRDALFGPLPATEVVALDSRLLGLALATEAPFVDEVREFLRHEFLDLLDGAFEAFLGLAGDVEVERRVLSWSEDLPSSSTHS